MTKTKSSKMLAKRNSVMGLFIKTFDKLRLIHDAVEKEITAIDTVIGDAQEERRELIILNNMNTDTMDKLNDFIA